MPNSGGRYEIRGSKRVRVEHTQPAPEIKPSAKATADATAAKPAKSKPVKESDNGDQMA
ncbi:hypothetical protein SAMN05661010_02519 [Modicisalibacter muralis]|uniref:Uncharacterized protein n=1 Tax=Modicisalibacter muralis TaxID=119000 RepID=A0A1G9MTV9_9GAMM|nr:hypothetical protein [Halomonas muralis]SDL77722.1 hypothetical protein SAMN05661010_02519 [Halomonas muralis]